MKEALTITLCLTLFASAAFADHIGIYADQGGTTCYVSSVGSYSGPRTPVYLIHKFNVGVASAVGDFKIVDMSGLFFYSAEFPPTFLVVGGLFTGLWVAYAGCLEGDIVIATLNYWNIYDIPLLDCTRTLEIVATGQEQGFFAPKVIACGAAYRAATSGRFFFGPPECEQCSNPLTTRSSTWGGVKALYR